MTSSSDAEFFAFPSRRSVVHSTEGIVACSQPLAARAGQRILNDGGNAADAAVAVAAALNMTEPSSTGIGGDVFCLFYDSKIKKVKSLNGSGRYPKRASLEKVRHKLGLNRGEPGKIPMTSVHSITTPGAAAGWVDTVKEFGSGKLSLKQILTPAIELGEKGFPISELASSFWQAEEQHLRNASPNFGELLKTDENAPDGKRAPLPGELFQNPSLANTFRRLGEDGKRGFYEGPVADALIKVVHDLGGYLSLEDLKIHAELGSEVGEPISLKFNSHSTEKAEAASTGDQGVELWEHPPNGQGIIALMTLGILEELQKTGKMIPFNDTKHNSAEYLHAVVESLRIAFADAQWWVTDPDVEKVPTREMISRSYLKERAKLFDPMRAQDIIRHGSPAYSHCDTVYFAVTDRYGNGISFINSNYGGFGTGIIPNGCGFVLQNRGAAFSLEEGHPNVLAPGKRPYHTIIPALVTNPNDQSLHTVFGVMGGFMQPQGHVQVLLNMLAFGLSPQAALDAPRIQIHIDRPGGEEIADKSVYLEDGIGEDVAKQLRLKGHNVEIIKGYERISKFGRGQVIRCRIEDGKYVYSAGSDLRADGLALPV